jgi:hypothetical protein
MNKNLSSNWLLTIGVLLVLLLVCQLVGFFQEISGFFSVKELFKN